MNPKTAAVLCFFMAIGFVAANYQGEYDDTPYKEPPVKGGPAPAPVKGGVAPPEEEPKPESSHEMAADPMAEKHKGFCHWGVAVYYKPGFQLRCSCMRCTCQTGGKWDCAYHFPYCPYYYCGNHIYNPLTQICCCGKVYDKKSSYSCCGYFYYYTKTSKCCNYYSVKPIKSHCPRDKIQ